MFFARSVCLAILSVFIIFSLFSCTNRKLPEKTKQASHHHDNGYEDADIQFVENGIVQVETKTSKIVIVFRPKNSEELNKFHRGWLAPVTFDCWRKADDNSCDFSLPYKTYISDILVEPIALQKRTR